MFWIAVLAGGGLIWNTVDGLAGLLLGSDGLAELFSLVCGFALVEMMGAGLVAGSSQLGRFAHGLIQWQLPALCLIGMCAVTRVAWRHGLNPAVATTVGIATYGFVHFKLWQWFIPNVVLGSNRDRSGPYLRSMGLPTGETSASAIRSNFNAVALHGAAVTMAIGATVVAVIVTSGFELTRRARGKPAADHLRARPVRKKPSLKYLWLLVVPFTYPGVLAIALQNAGSSSVLHTPPELVRWSYVIVPVTGAYLVVRTASEIRRRRIVGDAQPA